MGATRSFPPLHVHHHYALLWLCDSSLKMVYVVYKKVSSIGNCGVLNVDERRINEIFVAVRPLVIFDCLFIIVFGPIGNVYMFIARCPEVYVTIALRIGFYLSALSLPVVYSYLRNRDEQPQFGELKDFVFILVKLAVKLVTCSSCLATFITLAYPENISFRYIYLAFTLLVGLSALITYYETLVKLVKIALDKIDAWKKFHEWFSHFIFWPSTIANIGLLTMNAYILHKYLSVAGFHSSGVSLVMNCVGLVFGSVIYIFTDKFCGHGPLYKEIFPCFKSYEIKE